MWLTNITKDIKDLTNSFMEDTRNVANLVSRLAAEVTGMEVVCAGDEDSPLALQYPLEDADITSFQRDNMVYLDDISEEEKALFEAWARESEYSSQRPQNTCALPLQENGRGALATSRQRLLDNSSIVSGRHAAFVVREERHQPQEGKGVTVHGGRLSEDTDDEFSPGKRVVGGSEMGVTPLDEALRITEDVFFDRYFFRLARLRFRVAEERKKELERAAEEEESRRKAEGHENQEQKSFTQRLVEVADGFIGWDDSKEEGHGATQCTKYDWEAQQEVIVSLETAMQTLQMELSIERRKVAAILEAARSCGLSDEQQRRLHEAAQIEEPHVGESKDICGKDLQKAAQGEDMHGVKGIASERHGASNAKPQTDGEVPSKGEGDVTSEGVSNERTDLAGGVQFFVDKDGWTNVQ